jgi:hypothetical protein
MLRKHDPEMMTVPLEVGSLLDGFCFEAWRSGEELNRKSVDEKSFLVEFPKAEFAEAVKHGIERDGKRAR